MEREDKRIESDAHVTRREVIARRTLRLEGSVVERGVGRADERAVKRALPGKGH